MGVGCSAVEGKQTTKMSTFVDWKTDQDEINPADYFAPERTEGYYQSSLKKYWFPSVGVAFGFGVACFVNWSTRRPMISGLQQHALGVIAGGTIGAYADGWQNRKMAARDSLFYQYVQDHPEDFPPIERKKYKDVLETWIPIR